jgi:LPS O-antigen subunit length determinant protein (WzzB/FepE family)
MEEYIKRYLETKTQIDHYQKRMDKLRMKMKQYLKTNESKEWQTEEYKVCLQQNKRTILQKCDVPVEVWNEYNKTLSYESLTVRKRKKLKDCK